LNSPIERRGATRRQFDPLITRLRCDVGLLPGTVAGGAALCGTANTRCRKNPRNPRHPRMKLISAKQRDDESDDREYQRAST
jgi:hypothetical protein